MSLLFRYKDTSYTPPSGGAIAFDFRTVVQFIAPGVRSTVGLRYQPGNSVMTDISFEYIRHVSIDLDTQLNYGLLTPYDKDYANNFYKSFIAHNKDYAINLYRLFVPYDVPYAIPFVKSFEEIDKVYTIAYDRFADTPQVVTDMVWSVPDVKDVQNKLEYSHVRLYGVPRVKVFTYPAIIEGNLDFNFSTPPLHDEGNKEALIFDFRTDPNIITGEPIVTYLHGVLQPTGSNFALNTSLKTPSRDTQTALMYNALKDLVIGAGYKLTSGKDDDVNPPPPVDKEPIVHIPHEVYTIMNTVNITDILTGTVIQFADLSINRDIDSYVWTVNFTIKNDASLALVKPVGRTLKSINININGVDIRAFVGKTSKSQSVSKSSGVVTVVHKCNAWSELRRLGDPYSRKRSANTNGATTASTLVVNELTGSGQTVEWGATNWIIPGGIHSYQNKTPVGAILSVVNAIGAVIVPHLSNNTFKVLPRYPISPWAWDDAATIPDRTMSESQFFSIDNESIPVDNPDSVYVYSDIVGVHATRFGKNGSAPLPDVVDKYLSTAVACQERGRNEVARNSYLENIPMATYVDNTGLVMPQELIEFTGLDGDIWRGMVMSTSIVCQRIGTAILQKINVQRFHEDD